MLYDLLNKWQKGRFWLRRILYLVCSDDKRLQDVWTVMIPDIQDAGSSDVLQAQTIKRGAGMSEEHGAPEWCHICTRAMSKKDKWCTKVPRRTADETVPWQRLFQVQKQEFFTF